MSGSYRPGYGPAEGFWVAEVTGRARTMELARLDAREILMRAAEGGAFDEAPFDLRHGRGDVAVAEERKSVSRWAAERAAGLLGWSVHPEDLKSGGFLDGDGWSARFWQTVYGRAREARKGAGRSGGPGAA